MVADIRKKYDEAQSEYRRTAELSPQDGGLFYRLGNAYIAQRPDPKYNEAFWAFARAATMDGAGALQPAGRQQVDDYLRKIYEQYHGPDEEGFTQLKQQAKAQPFPPDGFKVLSKAEVAAAAPVVPEELSFDEIRDMLLKGEAKGEELWKKNERDVAGVSGRHYFRYAAPPRTDRAHCRVGGNCPEGPWKRLRRGIDLS